MNKLNLFANALFGFLTIAAGIALSASALAQDVQLINTTTVQKSACFGADPDSTKPLDAIYMGGLFPPSSEADHQHFVDLEMRNRTYLQKMAAADGLVIAVPLAPLRNLGGAYGVVHAWNNIPLQDIETAAASACHASLGKPRALIGFSSGAIRVARMLDDAGCKAFTDYIGVFVIGAQGVNGPQGGKCHNTVTEVFQHVFPPQAHDLTATLKNLFAHEEDAGSEPTTSGGQ